MKIVSEIIKKLDSITRKNEGKWENLVAYQSSEYNEVLRNYIIKCQKNYYTDFRNIYLDEQGSYVFKTKEGGIFVVLRYEQNYSDYYILAAQKTRYGKIVELNTKNDLQLELRNLVELINETLDSIDSFIESFLKE